jgi:hypothetical protein
MKVQINQSAECGSFSMASFRQTFCSYSAPSWSGYVSLKQFYHEVVLLVVSSNSSSSSGDDDDDDDDGGGGSSSNDNTRTTFNRFCTKKTATVETSYIIRIVLQSET